MSVSDQTIILSLSAGVVLGIVYILFCKIKNLFKRKKVVEFCIDFTFVAISSVVTFIVSLASSYGNIRLVNFLFEIFAFALMVYLSRIFSAIFNKRLILRYKKTNFYKKTSKK